MEQLIYSNKFYELLGDEVHQTLRCGVCLEYYSNPVILPCGHTFCYNCILEMAKYKKLNRMQSSLRDLRMNCPNCRLALSVHMVLQRNVTFNYPLASFIESLKKVQIPTMVDASTNTETDDDNAYEYDVQKLDEIRDDLDHLFAAFRLNSNVVDGARIEVDEIRKQFLKKQKVTPVKESQTMFGTGKEKKPYRYASQYILDQDFETTEDEPLSILSLFDPDERRVAPPPGFDRATVPRAAAASEDTMYQDPAIMSFGRQATNGNNQPRPSGQNLSELMKLIEAYQK